MSKEKHLYECPSCGHTNFHAFPCLGTVAFQCASCKQISTHEQLSGGDTSGLDPDDATHRDRYNNFWKLSGSRWKHWTVSGWEYDPQRTPSDATPIEK